MLVVRAEVGSPTGPSQATLVSMFFSFDGIDGVGKSTQFDRFCQWLTDQGHRVVTCRDPGSTPLGESLRDLLLHSGPDRPIGCTCRNAHVYGRSSSAGRRDNSPRSGRWSGCCLRTVTCLPTSPIRHMQADLIANS